MRQKNKEEKTVTGNQRDDSRVLGKEPSKTNFFFRKEKKKKKNLLIKRPQAQLARETIKAAQKN